MQMKLTIFILVLIVASHCINGAALQRPRPKSQSKATSNVSTVAQQCLPLSEALIKCVLLLEISKSWDSGPAMDIGIAVQYIKAISHLLDELLKTIAITIPSLGQGGEEEGLKVHLFLFAMARMAHRLAKEIYYAPVEVFTFGDDVPPEGVSKQLHAYLSYITHDVFLSDDVMDTILDIMKAFEAEGMFATATAAEDDEEAGDSIEELSHFFNAYLEAEDYVKSTKRDRKCAGIYAEAFLATQYHPDMGRFTSAVAHEHAIPSGGKNYGAILRRGCRRMGGSSEILRQRINGVEEAYILDETLYAKYREEIDDE